MVGNVAQGNFMQGGFSPNPHPPRNQQGLNQMMQPTFGFQNGMQVNPSMPGDPKKIYFNMVDPLQKENLRIQADVCVIMFYIYSFYLNRYHPCSED